MTAHQFEASPYTMIIPSSISFFASFLVMLTYVTFPDLRKLRYIELVFYVAINDFIASIGMALGPSNDGSAACWFQGLSTSYNFNSSVCWTTVMSYQVYLIVFYGQLLQDLTYLHLICWILPLVLTLLPLSTNTYGNVDDDSRWCFVTELSTSPHWSELFWVIVSFYLGIWCALLLNCFYISMILWKMYSMIKVPKAIVETIHKLILYPIIIIVCWTVMSISDIYSASSEASVPKTMLWCLLNGIGTLLAGLQGFFFALIFFSRNKIARNKWLQLFIECGVSLDIVRIRERFSNFYQDSSNYASNSIITGSSGGLKRESRFESIPVENEVDYIDSSASTTPRHNISSFHFELSISLPKFKLSRTKSGVESITNFKDVLPSANNSTSSSDVTTTVATKSTTNTDKATKNPMTYQVDPSEGV